MTQEVSGIIGISKGPVDLVSPPSSPKGEVWRYGLAVPFQVAPNKAGLFCNIREVLGPDFDCFDFEVGTDVVMFDDLENISAENAVRVSRNHEEVNPKTGEPSLMVKYPVLGGFVPLGAKRADGTPHPHAGTGFGLSHAVSWPLKSQHAVAKMNYGRYGTYRTEKEYGYLEMFQFAYDGERFGVQEQERIFFKDILPGWEITSVGLTPPVPDGDDFLFPASGRKVDADSKSSELGLCRWQRTPSGWRPVSFQKVTDEPHFGEMSLVRDTDGSLLYSARGGSRENCLNFRVWRSADNGTTWEDVLKVLWVRSAAPVTINQAADGTPYLVADLLEVPLEPTADPRKVTRSPGGWMYLGGNRRDKIYLWPMTPDRRNLEAPLVVRDCPKDFGPPPGGTTWSADHPIGLTLRLGDAQWHHVLAYRVLERGENGQGCAATPQTGCYLEEVFSAGPARSTRHF